MKVLVILLVSICLLLVWLFVLIWFGYFLGLVVCSRLVVDFGGFKGLESDFGHEVILTRCIIEGDVVLD